MNKKKLMPNQTYPVNRMMAGQLPPELAELAEETLCSHNGGDIVPSQMMCFGLDGPPGYCLCCACSYNGDDAE